MPLFNMYTFQTAQVIEISRFNEPVFEFLLQIWITAFTNKIFK